MARIGSSSSKNESLLLDNDNEVTRKASEERASNSFFERNPENLQSSLLSHPPLQLAFKGEEDLYCSLTFDINPSTF